MDLTIPTTTLARQTVASVTVYFIDAGTNYSSVDFVPVLIQPKNLQVVVFTDSFAPLVMSTVQKAYLYAYYGNASDFPSKDAFLFPASLKFTLYYNQTLILRGKTNTATNTTKGLGT